VLNGTLDDSPLGAVDAATGNKVGEFQYLVEARFFLVLLLFDIVDCALKDSSLARLVAGN
jgi:hypothetical protein